MGDYCRGLTAHVIHSTLRWHILQGGAGVCNRVDADPHVDFLVETAAGAESDMQTRHPLPVIFATPCVWCILQGGDGVCMHAHAGEPTAASGTQASLVVTHSCERSDTHGMQSPCRPPLLRGVSPQLHPFCSIYRLYTFCRGRFSLPAAPCAHTVCISQGGPVAWLWLRWGW